MFFEKVDFLVFWGRPAGRVDVFTRIFRVSMISCLFVEGEEFFIFLSEGDLFMFLLKKWIF